MRYRYLLTAFGQTYLDLGPGTLGIVLKKEKAAYLRAVGESSWWAARMGKSSGCTSVSEKNGLPPNQRVQPTRFASLSCG
jgi:hypothetical protein